jgi:hypothetical protein
VLQHDRVMAMAYYIKITQKLTASIIQYFKIQRMKTVLQKQDVDRSSGQGVKVVLPVHAMEACKVESRYISTHS